MPPSTSVHRHAGIVAALCVVALLSIVFWEPLDGARDELQPLWNVCRLINLWISPIALALLSRQVVFSWLRGARPRQEKHFGLLLIGYVVVVTLGSYQGWLFQNKTGPATCIAVALNIALIVRVVTWKNPPIDAVSE